MCSNRVCVSHSTCLVLSTLAHTLLLISGGAGGANTISLRLLALDIQYWLDMPDSILDSVGVHKPTFPILVPHIQQ